MKRIFDWFDRHMKTRIALQLVLDGLPFVLLVFPVALGMLQLEECVPPGWWDYPGAGCVYIMIYGGGAVLFVLGIWLRSRATIEFECYPWCKAVSLILRFMSAIPAVLSFGCLIGFVYLYFRNL